MNIKKKNNIWLTNVKNLSRFAPPISKGGTSLHSLGVLNESIIVKITFDLLDFQDQQAIFES